MPRPPDPERRATILRVARELFHERGYSQTTMAEIAAAANMGVGSLYVYFPTKEAIALALVDAYFAELHDAILPPLRELQGEAALASALARGFHAAELNQEVLALCRLVPVEHLMPARQGLLLAIEQALTDQMNQGYLRPLNPSFITQWVNGQIEWAITTCLVERRGSIADYQSLLTDVIVRALSP